MYSSTWSRRGANCNMEERQVRALELPPKQSHVPHQHHPFTGFQKSFKGIFKGLLKRFKMPLKGLLKIFKMPLKGHQNAFRKPFKGL